ncbi:cilia- and flagella-associated protein 20-like [Eupeodes corollae]|uniref:cilia- and flagella-associated protein 20-like n=1 Tax=Eupeodes corollae TaxID=290404 RepID=UPI0024909A85|nr:cilia- and flagella-associated protein 20-like [Eupeodes corollae]
MFKNAYQEGFLTIFYSIGSKPLEIWRNQVKNGHLKRIVDEDIKSMALEIMGTNVSTTFISAPRDPKISLAIKLPFLVLLLKNMRKLFTFEVQILDDQKFLRRFRMSNYESKTRVKTFCMSMPMGLSPGWNQIHLNLADFTRRAYGTNYIETVRVQIHANVRVRRIYFTNKLHPEEELPNEYKIMMTKDKKPDPKKTPIPKARPPTPEMHSNSAPAIPVGSSVTDEAIQ